MHRMQARRVLIVLLLGELALVASTWKLWFADSQFPRVSLWMESTDVPVRLIQFVSTWLIAAILFALWRLNGRGLHMRDDGPPSADAPGLTAGGEVTYGRWLWLAVLAPASLAACLNQHCLQPWHWLFLVAIGLRCGLESADFLIVTRRLVGTIYLFAALSRLGPEIASGMSRQIVVTGLDLSSLSFGMNSSGVIFNLCVLTTVFEGTIGLMLMTTRMLKAGTVLAVVMHLALILILGPVGLNQETGVLIWNGILCVLVVLLQMNSPPHIPANRMRVIVASAFCVLWPIFALIGVTHNWTGWQVYSPRPEVLQLQVHADHTDDLPDSVAPFVAAPRPLEEWCDVRLDRWSLSETGTPLYPQSGFQRAVAALVTASITDVGAVRGRLDSPDVPFWWRRHATEYSKRSEFVAR